ncbi:MAG: LPS export ABC transporter periplasmic protein LptC [Bacteroidales bacterium]|nr:LPS export ABC transporter periplasmic protein LptC [Bacteroidales bacterium]
MVALAGAIVVCMSCRNDEAVVSQVCHKEEGPTEITEDLLVYVSRSGGISYVFSAPLYYVYPSPKSLQVTPKGLKIVSFNADGDSAMALTADYGIHRENERLMEAKRHVVIRNLQSGEVVETEHIIWDMNRRRLYSNTQTRQLRPDGSVYIGESFESDEQFEQYTIVKPKLLLYEE